MPNSFEELMSKKSDEQLLKIVAGRPEDYQPEALEAAKKELGKRNFSAEQFETVTKEAVREKEHEAVIAELPLGVGLRMRALIFPFYGVMGLASTFRATGYHRKANEMTRWAMFGIALYATVFILISLLT